MHVNDRKKNDVRTFRFI